MQVRVRKSVIEALPTPSTLIIRQLLLISSDTSSLCLLSFVLLVRLAVISCYAAIPADSYMLLIVKLIVTVLDMVTVMVLKIAIIVILIVVSMIKESVWST